MIKNRLREIRLKLAAQQGRDIRQSDMAQLLNINEGQYSRFENQQAQPSLETAYRMAKKLGYIMEEIFYLDE